MPPGTVTGGDRLARPRSSSSAAGQVRARAEEQPAAQASLSVDRPRRWPVAMLVSLSVLLFTWTVLESLGFAQPVIELFAAVIVLVALPLAWYGAWFTRRRSLAADKNLRDRIGQVIADRSVMTVFQPIVDCRTAVPIGAEALSRFGHVEPAMTPDLWFFEATRLGLGVEFELAAAELALRAGSDLPCDIYLSVNLSPAAIASGRLEDLLGRSGWSPARLVLEITEHACISDYRTLTNALRELRRRGLKLAIDDAGAGYASFRHILALAPDFIKLDRSLVADIDIDPARQALTNAVVRFADDIGASVVAEGVETDEDLAVVCGLGVRAAQGYFTGRPVLVSAWTARSNLRSAPYLDAAPKSPTVTAMAGHGAPDTF